MLDDAQVAAVTSEIPPFLMPRGVIAWYQPRLDPANPALAAEAPVFGLRPLPAGVPLDPTLYQQAEVANPFAHNDTVWINVHRADVIPQSGRFHAVWFPRALTVPVA